MSDDVKAAIEENAQGPKTSSVDGVTITEHSLPEQIAADKYLRERAAANKRKLPIRLAKLKADGTA